MQRKIHLKGRLLKIADLVPYSDVVADIGCDHGRLCAFLLQNNKVNFAYASDISQISLKKAEQLCDKCLLSDKMAFIVADGLKGLPIQPDTIIIAGMGGELIAQILSNSPEVAKKACNIIMQPMRGIYELRKFLFDNNYHINNDMLCKESGRIYQIISASYVDKNSSMSILPDDFFELGEMMIINKDPLLPEYIERLYREYSKAVQNAKNSETIPNNLIAKLHTISAIKLNL